MLTDVDADNPVVVPVARPEAFLRPVLARLLRRGGKGGSGNRSSNSGLIAASLSSVLVEHEPCPAFACLPLPAPTAHALAKSLETPMIAAGVPSAVQASVVEANIPSPANIPSLAAGVPAPAARLLDSAGSGEHGGAILPGPQATETSVFQVYPIEMLYASIDKGQLGVNMGTEEEGKAHNRSMALYRKYSQALSDIDLRAKMLAALRKKCTKVPGCAEDTMSYYAKFLDIEQKAAAPSRPLAVELLSVRHGLLQHRPGNSFYLFAAGEQLEILGSMDRNDTILRNSVEALKGALISDSIVGVFDDVTRYKAWELIITTLQRIGDVPAAKMWMSRARATGYPWHSMVQLPYPRMFHPGFEAKPFWKCRDAEHLAYLCRLLESNYETIRSELELALRTFGEGGSGLISYTDSTTLVSRGNWTQIKLAGDDPQTKALVWRPELCAPAGGPFARTCALLRGQNRFASAITGAAKFYLLDAGSELKPHCGQGNLRLFMQLGVLVPQGVVMEVGGERRSWQEGKVLIFDDSFMHGVVHSGSSVRVTLSIPVWHPDIYHRFAHR
mmetsp:Transcript_30645/g.97669  ORF Transcript_30645/g.97669 Transcript_30645/m.97669 type:complete len:558 (+) Transcript_30645:1265-2938(+)